MISKDNDTGPDQPFLFTELKVVLNINFGGEPANHPNSERHITLYRGNTFIGGADLAFQDAPLNSRTNVNFSGKYIARITTFADYAGPGVHNYQIRFNLRADSFGYIRTTSVKVMGMGIGGKR